MSFPTDWQTVTHFFGTPLKVKFPLSFPVNQWLFWGFLTWDNGRRHPERSFLLKVWTGFWGMIVLLGSEWCHNLAHAAAARAIGKPMDELHVYFGMPRVVYHDINDSTVTPRQHILRAAAGPLFNLLVLLLARVARGFTRPNSPARDIADVAVAMNATIAGGGMMPIPGIDGGAMLKWGLVESGRTPQQADQTVQKVSLGLSGGLAGVFAVSLQKRRTLLAVIAGVLAAAALGVGMGWLKEK
jgi:hypothetical protein